MNRQSKHRVLITLLALVLVAIVPALALAAAGDTVDNTATVNFTVGANGFSNTSDDFGGSDASFVIDRLVDHIIDNDLGSSTSVQPGIANRALAFTLTNNGNGTQRYRLWAFQNTTGDEFNINDVRIYIDGNDDNAYDTTNDVTEITSGNLTSDLAAGGSVNLLIVANTPSSGLTSGDTSIIHLIANAVEDSGTGTGYMVNTPGANTRLAEDIVLGDIANGLAYNGGTPVADTAKNGGVSWYGTFVYQDADVSIVKTASNNAVWDPVNYNANPMMIPGSYITYTITLSNGAGATANAIISTVVDDLPPTLALDTAYIDGNLGTASPDGSGHAGDPGAVKFTADAAWVSRTNPANGSVNYLTADAGDTNNDGLGYASGTGTLTIYVNKILPADGSLAAGELEPGDSITLMFHAIVQ